LLIVEAFEGVEHAFEQGRGLLGRAQAPPDERAVASTDDTSGLQRRRRRQEISALVAAKRWEVARIAPTGSNPLVQGNASTGFRVGVVRIAGDEFDAAVAVARDPA
jgi:hypothetical protein